MQIIKQLRKLANPPTSNGTAEYLTGTLKVQFRGREKPTYFNVGSAEARQKIAELGLKTISFVE